MRLRREVAARAKRAAELGRTYKPSHTKIVSAGRIKRDELGRFAPTGAASTGLNRASASTRTRTGEARFTNDLNLSRKPHSFERRSHGDLRDAADLSRRVVDQRQSGVRAAVEKALTPKKSRKRKLNKAGHSPGQPWKKSKASKKPGKLSKWEPKDDPIPF